MKIWIRLGVGIVFGALLSVFLPDRNGETLRLLSVIFRFVVQAGRYVVFPLVFFSLALGTYRLRQQKRMVGVYARTGILIILVTLAFVVLGSASVMVLSPQRIPIIIEEDAPYPVPTFSDVLFRTFPSNLFRVFTDSGEFLLPVYMLAVFFGLVFAHDRHVSEPVILLFDSLSRIFYHLNRFVTDYMGFGFVFLSAYMGFQIRSVAEMEMFSQIVLILAVNTLLIVFVLLPVLLFFLGERRNPYRWLYGIAAPALTGFFSGDSYFSLGMLIRHGKENLGIPRKIGSTTFPLYAILGHSGTAMVASISFIVILRSYSSLEITLPQVILSMMYAFGVSFILGPVPGKGAMVALYLLSTFHGRGLEEGFLILRPIAPLLISVGVLLDVVTSSFISTVVTRQEDMEREIEPALYI